MTSSNSTKKPRLGRGLSSLIINSSEETLQTTQYISETGQEPRLSAPIIVHPPEKSGKPEEILLDQIRPNPFQPRRDFRKAELDELTESIRQQGIIQPLIVCESSQEGTEQPYVLIAGERRLRAARQAGLKTAPCVIRQASKQKMLEWALIENIQRSDLNPIERANAYQEYMDRFQITQSEAAERLGQARTTISNHIRILDLCEELRAMLSEGTLSFGHGKVLAALIGNPARQITIARKIVSEGLSVRETEQLIAKAQQPDKGQDQPRREAVKRPSYVIDAEDRLCQAVGTRVRILPGRAKNSGRIVVDYYSIDDFDRISSALGMSPE